MTTVTALDLEDCECCEAGTFEEPSEADVEAGNVLPWDCANCDHEDSDHAW